MKILEWLRVVPVAPVETHPSACRSCGTFRPEVVVPLDGDDVALLCWYCAHQVADHEVCVAHAHAATCTCPREAVFPPDVAAATRRT